MRVHHKPLSRDDIKPFFAAVSLARPNRQTEIAVHLLLLTMVRTIELRCAPWTEINLEGAEWRIPAARMKMRRDHIVPLSKQAVDLLSELRTLTGAGIYLFPNTREPGRPMSPAAIDKVFRRAGYCGKCSPHSFRGTAATMLKEAGFDDRLIELQLAHSDEDKSRASYNHAELLGPRRQMLQAWADLIGDMS